jgi:uracil-DNA glycosylase
MSSTREDPAGGAGLCMQPRLLQGLYIGLPSFVTDLARAEIGSTYNQYAASPLLCARLAAYLVLRDSASILLVGEAAGYRGARVSGIPFTSERQLSGCPPGETSATVVHAVLAELGLEREVLLWNLVPTHPHERGNARSNRRPTRDEVEAGRPFLRRLTQGRRIVAVGRLAHAELGGPYVRHPSHGGAREFRAALVQLLS